MISKLAEVVKHVVKAEPFGKPPPPGRLPEMSADIEAFLRLCDFIRTSLRLKLISIVEDNLR